MRTAPSRFALRSILPATLLALAAPVVSAQPGGSPVSVTIKGRVLDDENKTIPGDPVKITVKVTGVEKLYGARSEPDGSYEIRDMPLGSRGQRIEYVRFEHAAMHPQFVRLLSGVDSTEVINKLMTAPPGPESYEDIFDQLLAYEGIYYTRVAIRKATEAELDYYRDSLRKMAGPGSTIYSDMEQGMRMDMLVKKRAEVFRMYGLDPEGAEQVAGLGLCAMCSLGLKGECHSSVVAFANGQPRLFFLTGQGKGSPTHDLVCHTSLMVIAEGKVIRPSVVGADGKVVAGEFRPTSFVPDRRPQPVTSKDLLIAGVGKCGKCDLNARKECQNVIVANWNSRPSYNYLQPDEMSGAIHMSGQAYVIRGEFVEPPRPSPSGSIVSLFKASKIAVLVGGAGTGPR